MAILLYWGEDEFALNAAVQKLVAATVEPAWASFNLQQWSADRPEEVLQGLNQAMTAPFGSGQRLVWLANATVLSQSHDNLGAELGRTLPQIPPTTVLLITCAAKPDGRSKLTKLVQKHAEVREFALLPPWKEAEIGQQVQRAVTERQVVLTPPALELLTTAVGNNSRQLDMELSKLQLFAAGRREPLTAEEVESLVTTTTHNSLQLAAALRQGEVATALEAIGALLARNEPGLKIVATLVGQFRTWLLIKAAIEAGLTDEAIAKEAELGNPKRLYFLRKELQGRSASQLAAALQVLGALEFNLKQGHETKGALQNATLQIAACWGG